MRRLRSWLGLICAALYGAALLYAYVDYSAHAGQMFADLLLAVIALPFTLTMRALAGGSFDFSGDMTLRVAEAFAFCCALAYCAGLAVESLIWAVFRVVVRR